MVAHLAEHAQRGVEDALLRALTTGSDTRVVGERGAAQDSVGIGVGRYADVYERYEPVFNSFPAAAESDSTLAGDSVRTSDRYTAGLRSRVERTPLPPRDVDPLIDLLLTCLPRALDDGATLRHAAPRAYPLKALLDAYADVAHRTLFGRLPGLNVHDRSAPSPPRLPFREVEPAALASAPNGAARTALLHAARSVFATRGYHGTRVVDIVAAAGVSHGAFYSYFKSKDEVAHLLAAHAMREVSIVLSEIPPSAGEGAANRAALKRWLREYNRAQASETAMIRVRIDAGRQDDSMLADSAGLLDWGRRRLARFLSPRGFGDADTDAVVLLALLDALGTRERPARTIDAALQLIERGFLGR